MDFLKTNFDYFVADDADEEEVDAPERHQY